MILLSLALHLLTLFVCSYNGMFKPTLREAAPYYVDIVSLPALAPDAASPEPPAATPALPVPPSPAAKPPSSPAKALMTLPAKTVAPSPAKSEAASAQEAREQEAREFAQRMSRLEHNSEAKHQAEALASLQKKVAGKKSPTGSAVAAGSDKGSDYGAYIQSRLKDALATTIVYQSKAPEAAVRLYIDKKGKLTRYVMEKPSADKLFNDAVIRAIEKAKPHFPPPPTAAAFDKLFVFSPQEVTK
jgi:colicin import membrane protein